MNIWLIVLIAVVMCGAIVGVKLWRWVKHKRQHLRASRQEMIELRARINIARAQAGFLNLMFINEGDIPTPEQIFWYFTQEVEPVRNPFTGLPEPILEQHQALTMYSEGVTLAGRTMIKVNRQKITIFVLDRDPMSTLLAEELKLCTPAITA